MFSAEAQEAGATDTLLIGYAEAPPFLIKNGEDLTGINAWLWKKVANDEQLVYKLVEMPFPELFPALESGQLDLCINPLTITSGRRKTISFTDPYFASYSTVAVPKTSSLQRFLNFVSGFFNINFLRGFTGLILLIFIFGLLGWYFERRKNPEHFRTGIRGVWDGLWWSAVTLTTVGYGDKAPKSSAGKIIALALMFIGLLFISGLTASIASSLTVNELSSTSENFDSFKNKKVGTVSNSSSVKFLKSHFFRNISEFESVHEGLSAMQNGKVEAFVYDEPLLRYRIDKDSSISEVSILPLKFDVQFYAFGITPLKRELETRVSRRILTIVESKDWEIVLSEYGLTEF